MSLTTEMDCELELLSPERIEALWPEIKPLVDMVPVPGGSDSPFAVDTDYIWHTAIHGVSHIFGFFAEGKLAMVLVSQFGLVEGIKTASILTLAGKDLTKFKILFWPTILEWFRANGAKSVDTYAEPRLAKIYLRKFGFTNSCSYVRMTL